MPLNVGLSSCGSLCQHPACWDAVRKREKGITKSLPPLDSSSSSDDSDSELNLPTQSVCNLLSELGESPRDRYPLSTSGRPSHQSESPVYSVKPKQATLSSKKLQVPHNTKASLFSKSTGVPRQRHCLPRMEVQEVFDCTDLNSHWDETFVTKQYYIWVANPHKRKRKRHSQPLTGRRDPNAPVLMKDMTESMVPSEIEQQREDTVLFDEWPVLKKRQPRTGSPPSKPIQFKKPVAALAILPPPPSNIDMEGINELLALPKDVLVKVLENTKKSDFTSKGKLHSIVQECVQENESARMILSTREFLKQNKMNIHKIPMGSVRKSQPTPPKPVFQLDDEVVIERMSSANTPVQDKACSDDSSIESFPRYTKPLPNIKAIAGQPNNIYHLSGPGQLIQAPDSMRGPPLMAKLPSISLGLPELPSGVRTTKAFAYNNKDMMDFTLGPMISPPSTDRSSFSGDYSEHGTTIKVNAPLSGHAYMEMLQDNDMAIHSVSPALSTHVPVAPAGTPATFMSPTKSAPNLRDISRDPTQVTINLSLLAQPSSKDMREMTLLSSPTSNTAQHLIPAATPAMDPMTPDDKGLDTIRETAREAEVEGSVVSTSLVKMGDKIEEGPKLVLQTSTLTNINTGASPLPKSARSVESCPSPEQWPLISELSFEKMLPRSSISEPALSGRSGRRSLHKSHDDGGKGLERDYARKVLDEKRTAESPAPPPPSPEPKDSNEYRARKDIKSRESLSMAPLFEVNEIDEMENDENRLERDGRRKQVRKIHAVIPQAKTDDDNKRMESEDSEEVMVSQITVTHVAPKGSSGQESSNEIREKVQETFLNVDIPAEEISSCRAEHGSSHQEDISSSNESGGKSEVTTTESQVSASTTAGQGEAKEEKEDKDDENDEKEIDQGEVIDPPQTHRQLSLEESQYLKMQSDNIHRIDSAKLNSEDSGTSPELICDSARFLSHDLVSPMEGDIDGAQMQMMTLLQIVEGTVENQEGMRNVDDVAGERVITGEPGDEEQKTKGVDGEIEPELDYDNKNILGEESKRSDSVLDSSVKGREESATSKETDQSVDIEPPGSFFFQQDGANTHRSVGEGCDEEKKITENESTDILGQSETEKELSAMTENTEGISNIDTERETTEINENKQNGPVNDETEKENSSVLEEKESSSVVEEKEISIVIEKKESSSVGEEEKETTNADTKYEVEGDSVKEEKNTGEIEKDGNENSKEEILVNQNNMDSSITLEKDSEDNVQKDLENNNAELEDKTPSTNSHENSDKDMTPTTDTEKEKMAEELENPKQTGDE